MKAVTVTTIIGCSLCEEEETFDERYLDEDADLLPRYGWTMVIVYLEDRGRQRYDLCRDCSMKQLNIRLLASGEAQEI